MRSILPVLSAALLLAAPPGRKNLLHVPVSVQGDAEPALTAESLSIELSGAAVRPLRLLGPRDDLVLLVVTDLAGDLTLAEQAKSALTANIDRLPSNAAVALLQAQNGLRVLVDPTAERTPVKAAIGSLRVSGKAGLLESIENVTALGDAMLAKAAVRLAVLFVTDSDVSNYREDFTNPVVNWSDSRDMSRRFRDSLIRERISKLDTALASVETPIFVLHLAYRTDVLNQAYQTGLMTLSATTGGRSYFCRSQAEVAEAMDRAFAAIASQYSLTVALPEKLPKVVDVSVESAGRSLDWRGRFTIVRE